MLIGDPRSPIAPKAEAAIEEVFDQYTGPFSGDSDNAFTNEMLAQSFVASASYKITRIELFINDLGMDDVATLALMYNDPTLNVPATPKTGSTANGENGWDWVSFAIPDIDEAMLTAGSIYWIELIDSNNNQVNAYGWGKRMTNPMYPSGEAASCSGSNCKWQRNPGTDYLFRIYGIYGPSIEARCEVNSAFAGMGDPLNYTIHFDNSGTQYAPNVWINMTLSGNVTYVNDDSEIWGGVVTHSSPSWLFKNVVVGSHSFHVNATVDWGVRDGSMLKADFTFNYSDSSGEMQEERTCSVMTVARVPSLSMFKEVLPTFSIQGGVLNYTITFTNSGSRPAATVWVNDTLPNSLNYILDTTNNGTGPGNTSGILVYKSIIGNTLSFNFTNVGPYTFRFNLSATVNPAVLNGTPITNCASLNYTDSSKRVIGPVMACATARVEGASIVVKKEALDNPVARDDALRYQITFDNQGTAPAAFVWINDTLPQGVAYVDDTARTLSTYDSVLSRRDSGHLYYVFRNVQPNDPLLQPRSFIVTVLVGQTVNDGDLICNHVELNYTDWDNSRLMWSYADSCANVMIPNIVFSVQGTPLAGPGDFVRYNVTISNIGSGMAKQVTLILLEAQQLNYYFDNSTEYNRFPPLQASHADVQTWTFLHVGRVNIVVTFSYKLRVGLPDNELVTSEFDMNYTDYKGRELGSAQRFVSTTVTTPVIALDVIQNMTQVPRGDEITYTIFYNNTGHGNAKNVWINDTIPDETVFWRSSQQYIASSGGRITWHFTEVAPGNHNMTVTLRVDNQAAVGSILDNTIDLIYEDGNGNYIDRLFDACTAKVVDGTGDQPTFLQNYMVWLLVAILLIILACMWLFVGRKFYGFGVKDKARIDELFLLHRSGELIRHHSRSLRVDVDSDVLSGMLVAVQNFVKESFNFRAGDLEELKFGNQKIMLIHGEHVILAAVVAGPFPQRLEPGMRAAMDEIESRFGSSLDDWSGLTEDLPQVDDILSDVFDAKAG
jgi:uncharacterized repeat protein (TIGR01451 family)